MQPVKRLCQAKVLSLALVLLVLTLSACGGGDSSPAPQSPPLGNSNWDSLVWDQDNWN